jgi:hypothetical protein
MKKPFGTAKMVDLTAARYLAWEDAFEIDFADGLTFLEHPQAEPNFAESGNRARGIGRGISRGVFCPLQQRSAGGSSVVVHS